MVVLFCPPRPRLSLLMMNLLREPKTHGLTTTSQVIRRCSTCQRTQPVPMIHPKMLGPAQPARATRSTTFSASKSHPSSLPQMECLPSKTGLGVPSLYPASNFLLIWTFCSEWTEPAPGRNKEHDSTAAKSRYVPNHTIRILLLYLTSLAAIVEMETATMPPANLVCIFLVLFRASLTYYCLECLSRPQVDFPSTLSNGEFPSSVLP